MDQYWDAYSYCGADPVNYVDEWGLEGDEGVPGFTIPGYLGNNHFGDDVDVNGISPTETGPGIVNNPDQNRGDGLPTIVSSFDDDTHSSSFAKYGVVNPYDMYRTGENPSSILGRIDRDNNDVTISMPPKDAFYYFDEYKWDVVFPEIIGLKFFGMVYKYKAYEIAKNGGKHGGFLKNYSKLPINKIKKAIKSIEEEIAEHKDKILNPEKYIKEWKSLDPRQQKDLIEKKWPGDIKRQQEQVDILKGLIEFLEKISK